MFNEWENSNVIIADIEPWMWLHPLLKVLPVMWDYTIPFGLFHSLAPRRLSGVFWMKLTPCST